ncbi:MAG: GHMP kinase [bacterium]|nr:GHMP kinase [bacterium]
MFRIVEGDARNLDDVMAFLDLINGPGGKSLFDPREIYVARAPGRLDVMGGIADYSGSLVLQMPIHEATCAALQRNDSGILKMVSVLGAQDDRAADFEMDLADFSTMDYESAQAYFRRDPSRAWAAYAAGVFLVLMRERGVRFDGGVRLLISSRVPEGKGVSSSAAIEVAVMQAVIGAFELAIAPRDVALLCQKVENRVVGAPCGVMDQMTSVCARQDELLVLLCQPAELQSPLSIPEEVGFWGVDSGIRHAVSGADYTSVRVGAFMGYRILAELAGMAIGDGLPRAIADSRWGGYLANVTPSEFEQHFQDKIPESLLGKDFLDRYGATTDTVTQIDPGRIYAVRKPAQHPIGEHFRVQMFRQLLTHAQSDQVLLGLGELMYQSHASYSACGLGSEGTDRLVSLARERGRERGLFGAKITGGGSGGTVAILGRRNAENAVAEVADCYARETGREPHVFRGSSPGASAFGHLLLKKG